MKTIVCVNCKDTFHKKHEQKYCSNKCQFEYQWIHRTVLRIETGNLSDTSRKVLKRYLIWKHGNKCSLCGVHNSWQGKELVLQIDHIDGDSDNNVPNNLRLLCPNCHSQTETYGSKGIGNKRKKSSYRNSYLQKYKTPG